MPYPKYSARWHRTPELFPAHRREHPIYHAIVAGDQLSVEDSEVPRIVCAALRDESLRAGHYKLPFVERFAPRTRHFGPGRIFITELTPRDVRALVEDDKAMMIGPPSRLRINGGPSLDIGKLHGIEHSVHGGGETLSKTACVAQFQPLTNAPHAIRLHNADLIKLMDFFEPRLRCAQLVVLSVLPGGIT